MGVRRLVVANGPNIFQMLLVRSVLAKRLAGKSVSEMSYIVQLEWGVALIQSVSIWLVSIPGEMLQNGDRREVEIRGCTIWAVEASSRHFRFYFHTVTRRQQNGIIVDGHLTLGQRACINECGSIFV